MKKRNRKEVISLTEREIKMRKGEHEDSIIREISREGAFQSGLVCNLCRGVSSQRRVCYCLPVVQSPTIKQLYHNHSDSLSYNMYPHTALPHLERHAVIRYMLFFVTEPMTGNRLILMLDFYFLKQ